MSGTTTPAPTPRPTCNACFAWQPTDGGKTVGECRLAPPAYLQQAPVTTKDYWCAKYITPPAGTVALGATS